MTATALTQLATVFVPVDDQDEATTFYRDVLGFEQRVDFTYGTPARSKWRRPDQRLRWPSSR
jgi:catechol 2,3-dioxygenase-like lactoylglutathione lyase family enzyme